MERTEMHPVELELEAVIPGIRMNGDVADFVK
jgi:hypothetical protein